MGVFVFIFMGSLLIGAMGGAPSSRRSLRSGGATRPQACCNACGGLGYLCAGQRPRGL